MNTLLNKQADRALEQYWDTMDKALATARAGHVIPWCDKHMMRFSSGMGTWCLFDRKGMYIDSDDAKHVLPVEVYNALTVNCLGVESGACMEGYTPKGYKGKS